MILYQLTEHWNFPVTYIVVGDIESQLSSEDLRKINDGENIYSVLPATAILECDKHPTCKVHIVFSDSISNNNDQIKAYQIHLLTISDM